MFSLEVRIFIVAICLGFNLGPVGFFVGWSSRVGLGCIRLRSLISLMNRLDPEMGL